MKPWLKRTLVGLFGATALLGGVTACSHAAHGPGGWHAMSDEDIGKAKTRIVDKLGDKLELNADKKAKLAVLLDRVQEQRAALHRSGQLHGEIQALVKDNTFDRWHAQDLVNNELNAVREKSPAVIAALGDFYDSLTPAQQQRVREHLQRIGERRWGRRG